MLEVSIVPNHLNGKPCYCFEHTSHSHNYNTVPFVAPLAEQQFVYVGVDEYSKVEGKERGAKKKKEVYFERMSHHIGVFFFFSPPQDSVDALQDCVCLTSLGPSLARQADVQLFM